MEVFEGGELQVRDVNLVQVLFETVARHGAHPAFRVRDPQGPDGYRTFTWTDAEAQVREVAHGLMSLGVAPGDRVAILADTRLEWALADYGTLAAGGVTVSIYPTLTAEQVLHLLNDSGARFLFVENADQHEKVAKVLDRVNHLERIITFDPVDADGEAAKRTFTLEALREAGRNHARDAPDAVDERVQAVGPDDLATLIYTSGTTGTPKGAMLTHRNFVAACEASIRTLKLGPRPRSVAFLPLSHSYARQNGFLLAQLGGTATFGSPRTLREDFQATRPTIIASVPRLYERMYDQIQRMVDDMPARRQRIFRRAEAVAREYGEALADGGTPPLALRLQHALFDRLVYAKIREALGFTDLQMAVTGSAAMRRDLLVFFQGIGVNILEGYGLTETAAPSNVNPPERWRPGTVGPPLPGMRMGLDDDGEVLMHGPNVFRGYYNLPDEDAAAFTEIDGERWFRTGDIGRFDDAGYLHIIDRKKELEVLDTGKNIAPVPVEEHLKASPWITEAMLIATDRKYAGCLLQPDYDRLVEWARERGIPLDESAIVVQPDPTGSPMTYAVGRDLLDHDAVQGLYQREVAKANEAFADFEQVKTFRLVDHAFTIDHDELTMTLKKKRRVIREHYAELIESMF